ncbi:MAG: NAD(P)H-hydrate dehydratase [Balneolaceae bacterium]|nr:NAD(P)H-hydrate dehydratase [Balneolaceae bacterium]
MSTRIVPHPEWILTAEQGRNLDRQTIERFGIDGFTLMEMAGTHTARRLLDCTVPGDSGLLFCGKGNNAGDALVAARWLLQLGRPLTVLFVSGTGDLSPSAAKNLELLRKVSEEDNDAAELLIIDGWEEAWENYWSRAAAPPADFDFIVDGMLGTGLDSELRAPYPEAVTLANEAGLPVFAVDIPTGLHADRGVPLGGAVRADETLTYGTRKPGLYLGEGPEHAGRITFCELPFPNYMKKEQGVNTFLIDRGWVGEPGREPARHKYEKGVVYVLGGSEGLTGAALMSAQSAWGAGAGAVIWIAPRGLLSRVEGRHPQIITRPVGEAGDLRYTAAHAREALAIMNEKHGTALLGPGLGRADETQEFVEKVAGTYSGELVIDADGLRALAAAGLTPPGQASWILTPHPGELGDLLGKAPDGDYERLQRVRAWAADHGVTLLSKGYPSIVGTSDGNAYITGYDTRVFSRAGFGDVLSGKIAALCALGHQPLQSCCLAMLDGIERVAELNASGGRHIPEPLDLI